MYTVKLSYEHTTPAIITTIVKNEFNCYCSANRIDENYFQFTTIGCTCLDELADFLAGYE